MTTPNGSKKALTILGSIGAAAVAIVAIMSAWELLGLPRFARAQEVNQLKQFSVDTRVMLLEDQLWDAQREFSAAQREIEEYDQVNKSAPRWLREDLLSLKRTIDRRQRELLKLR